MPDVTFLNSIDVPIHIGIWAVTLHHYTNQLAPNVNWTVHLASSPYTVEIRAGDEDTNFNERTSGEAMEKINAIWGYGTVSVLTTVGWGLGRIGLGGRFVKAASTASTEQLLEAIYNNLENAIEVGASYLEDGPGHVLTVPQIAISFDEGQYSVRRGDGKGWGWGKVQGKVQLWDDKDGRIKGEAA